MFGFTHQHLCPPFFVPYTQPVGGRGGRGGGGGGEVFKKEEKRKEKRSVCVCVCVCVEPGLMNDVIHARVLFSSLEASSGKLEVV